MNLPLMLEVRRMVLAEPETVDMRVFQQKRGLDSCLTVNCIAGKTLVASGYTFPALPQPDFDVVRLATSLLDLSEIEAQMLFYFHAGAGTPYWDLTQRLSASWWGSPQYAEIVAAAIDRCIERNSRETPALGSAGDSDDQRVALLAPALASAD